MSMVNNSTPNQVDLTKNILKAIPQQNPVLQRLSAKLSEEVTTGNITRYDRMYHRHSRN